MKYRLNESWRNFQLSLNIVVVISFCLVAVGSIARDDGITCIYKKNGVSCSSCGLTNSLQKLLSGDIKSSLAIEPAGIWIALWSLLVFAIRPLSIVFPRRWFVVFDTIIIFGGWIGIVVYFFL